MLGWPPLHTSLFFLRTLSHRGQQQDRTQGPPIILRSRLPSFSRLHLSLHQSLSNHLNLSHLPSRNLQRRLPSCRASHARFCSFSLKSLLRMSQRSLFHLPVLPSVGCSLLPYRFLRFFLLGPSRHHFLLQFSCKACNIIVVYCARTYEHRESG